MKRFLLLNMTLLFCATTLSGQTYRYSYMSKVDENEVRQKYETATYITFTNNKQIMYESDEYGNAVSNGYYVNTFKLTSKQNGVLTYSFVYPTDPRENGNYSPQAYGFYVGYVSGLNQRKVGEKTFSFSSDYKRLNKREYDTSNSRFYIYVAERKEKEEVKAPSVMY